MKPLGQIFDAEWKARCRIIPCLRDSVKPMVYSHYLHAYPAVPVAYLALLCEDAPVGAIVFALPPRETTVRYGCLCWELARLWVSDAMPTNTESWFIGKAIKWVRRYHPEVGALVSYADPSVGHAGTIYLASNWVSDGATDDERKTPRADYIDESTGRKYSRRSHVPHAATLVRTPRVSKHRYVYRLSTSARSGSANASSNTSEHNDDA